MSDPDNPYDPWLNPTMHNAWVKIGTVTTNSATVVRAPKSFRTKTFIGKPDFELTEDIVTRLWEKLYNRPAIVPCKHCASHNAVTNPVCVQCGAPMGA